MDYQLAHRYLIQREFEWHSRCLNADDCYFCRSLEALITNMMGLNWDRHTEGGGYRHTVTGTWTRTERSTRIHRRAHSHRCVKGARSMANYIWQQNQNLSSTITKLTLLVEGDNEREEENGGLLPASKKAEALVTACDTTVKVQTSLMDSSRWINVECQRQLWNTSSYQCHNIRVPYLLLTDIERLL